MRNPTICICENKITDSTISLLSDSKFLTCFCHCTGHFVSDLFGNHIVLFSHVVAHILAITLTVLCDLALEEELQTLCFLTTG